MDQRQAAAELEAHWVQVSITVLSCGGTVEHAAAALVCHENVQPKRAGEIAAYGERVWRASLHHAAETGKPPMLPPAAQRAEVLAKVPAIGLSAKTLNLRFADEGPAEEASAPKVEEPEVKS